MPEIKAFFAYPFAPADLAETVREAVKGIQQIQPNVKITRWEDLNVTGALIIDEILNAIDECDIFLCDLTDLNPNVLFELGFAIARKKKVWPILNPNIVEFQEKFKRFKILTTTGYRPYNNSGDIIKNFLRDRPFDNIEKTLFRDAIEKTVEDPQKPKMLFLRSGVETEASIRLARIVEKSGIPTTIDDPQEIQGQSFAWYAQHTYSAPALITHFLSSSYQNHELHNAKCAFVAGLATGFDASTLMLAHEPFIHAPIDYRDRLFIHATATECATVAEEWLAKEISKNLKSFLVPAHSSKPASSFTDLQRIALGEFVAENERENLRDYFVRTAAFNEALRNDYTIFIGRKGTGKTANFYVIHDTLLEDKRNYVCLIKPPSYELEGVLRILRHDLPTSEQGYLIEALWKFLIYSELTMGILEQIVTRPSYLSPNPKEVEFIRFIEANRQIFSDDFSIRLDNSVRALQEIPSLNSAAQQRARISELLHTEVIGKTRRFIKNLLSDKNKVVILIDNLDKAWKKGADLEELSSFLFGLISVSQDIPRDFRRSSGKGEPLNLSVAIFLRSDIFQQMMRYAREPDKMSYRHIDWNDKELLSRVIEERLLQGENSDEEIDVWAKYFTPNVQGITTKDYILSKILPRPRDLVYFVRAALTSAINRGHAAIEEPDLLSAEQEYSFHALESLIVEASPPLEQVENLIYEFAGSTEILTETEVKRFMEEIKVPLERHGEYITTLIGMSFFGLETKPGEFTFIYADKDQKKAFVMAKKVAERSSIVRYKINRPFTAFLELTN